MSRLLILRPEPGAAETAARARAKGFEPVVAPLFVVRCVAWEPPADEPDAILLTSANAARCAGFPLHRTCYAVGEATAEAARRSGASDVRTGPADGAAALEMMASDGIRSALHLCGRDHVALSHPAVRVERRIIYAADSLPRLPDAAAQALADGALALLHSPRAAAVFAAFVPDRSRTRVAAISRAAADAAGDGWAVKDVAEAPRDEALLELAARLCHNPPPGAAAAGS